MTPRTFLPKDRDGCLIMIKEHLYDRLADVSIAFRTPTESPIITYTEIVNGEIAFIRNMLDLIERS